MALRSGIYIVGAKRTAFGTFGGSLKSHSATQLSVISSKAAIQHANISPEKIDTVIIGNVCQSSTDAAYLARHVALHSGAPISTPALTINRLCGSGFQALINGVHEIALGEANVALVGGTENMSQAPYAVRDVRWGTRLGSDPVLEDTLWAALTDSYCKTPMAITAENLAEKYQITRQECDLFALGSQSRWAEANKAGVFKDEITPIELKSKKGMVAFEVDEHPKPGTTEEALAKLSPVFKKDGIVTAGGASGISDGSASLVIASEKAVKENNLKPLARIASYSVVGVPPNIMGIGPAPAIRLALERAGRTLEEIDLFEVNEAFAAQFLAVEKELSLPRLKTNIHGGGIALGHPLAASGARILSHLTHQIVKGRANIVIGSACIGGGQGIAVVLEKP
jgi:acetyl-CoA acyltransferase 2